MKNTTLYRANQNKRDELYTQYKDIENTMNILIDFNENVFKDKIVLLPCDNPKYSNFTKYFINNFEKLGLKQLISTSYSFTNKGKIFIMNRGDIIKDIYIYIYI